MIEIKFTDSANKDIRAIKNYVSNDEDNTSLKVINNLINKIGSLSTFPNMGVSCKNKLGFKTSYRCLICDNYLVFYLFEKEIVFISRIVHGARDYIKELDFRELDS